MELGNNVQELPMRHNRDDNRDMRGELGARELLQMWLDESLKSSDDIDKLWNIILAEDLNTLGATKHILLEKVALAALDSYDCNVARHCIKKLYADFPNNIRVMRLEATTNSVAQCNNSDKIHHDYGLRHRISILRALGHTERAINEVRQVLNINNGKDSESWHQLSDMYLELQQHVVAAKCTEEALMTDTKNYRLHRRLADIYYTIGGLHYLECARFHYRFALELNQHDTRCLLGLSLVSSQIVSLYRSIGRPYEQEYGFVCWTRAMVTDMYQDRHGAGLAQLMNGLQLDCGI